jgi:hypothetical protein
MENVIYTNIYLYKTLYFDIPKGPRAKLNDYPVGGNLILIF